VYHDYLAGYGSEGCYVSDKPNRLALYQIGMNLVCGKMPAVALWSRWLDPEKLDPAQRQLLRAHLDLWRGPAGEFLNFGQRVAAPDLDVPSLEMKFAEKDGKTRRTLAVPSVLHGVWKLPDGRTGTIFACVGDKPVEFPFGRERLTLQPGAAAFRSSHGPAHLSVASRRSHSFFCAACSPAIARDSLRAAMASGLWPAAMWTLAVPISNAAFQ
jgi:hypothetical protein